MKLAIMQPYIFPYLGYFQLVNYVDKFIFYDDVNFIKNGWVNRNRLLVNKQVNYITIPVKNQSSFLKINEIEFVDYSKKILKTIEYNYCKAAYFDSGFSLVEKVFQIDTNKISDLAINSVKLIAEHLEIKTHFEKSSELYSQSINCKREERLYDICNQNLAKDYVNLIGGEKLYSKEKFKLYNINLLFILCDDVKYNQGEEMVFHPNLSIIDVLMHNGKDKTKEFLKNYIIK
jgi:hypothetical protein